MGWGFDMSRSRNIKPGFFKNDVLAECDPLARLLFAGLWCLADREGRLEDRPKKIKAECLPYDDCDCDGLLDQLAGRGFIVRYVVDSVGYIFIAEFKKHQNPHVKEQASTIPAPPTASQGDDMPSASTVQAQEIPERAGLIPDSLSLDSLNLIPDSLEKPESSNDDSTPAVAGPVAVIAEVYHEMMTGTDPETGRVRGCARIEVWGPKRRKKALSADKLAADLCKQRGWEYARRRAEFWRAYFAQCQLDPWLRGDRTNPNNPNWKQNLFVLIDEERFTTIMDKALTSMGAENE